MGSEKQYNVVAAIIPSFLPPCPSSWLSAADDNCTWADWYIGFLCRKLLLSSKRSFSVRQATKNVSHGRLVKSWLHSLWYCWAFITPGIALNTGASSASLSKLFNSYELAATSLKMKSMQSIYNSNFSIEFWIKINFTGKLKPWFACTGKWAVRLSSQIQIARPTRFLHTRAIAFVNVHHFPQFIFVIVFRILFGQLLIMLRWVLGWLILVLDGVRCIPATLVLVRLGHKWTLWYGWRFRIGAHRWRLSGNNIFLIWIIEAWNAIELLVVLQQSCSVLHKHTYSLCQSFRFHFGKDCLYCSNCVYCCRDAVDVAMLCLI